MFGWSADQRLTEDPILAMTGKRIPDELALGPAPAASPPPGQVDEGMRWMVDFDTAVDAGMALRIPLDFRTQGGLARLVVVGVKREVEAGAAGKRLAAVMRSHAYTRGLGFLSEGTSTNNTQSGPSGFSSTQDDEPPPAGKDPPPESGSNRALAARAFGFDDAAELAFAGVPNAATVPPEAARAAMNNALWPVTWRYFLAHMVGQVTDRDKIEDIGRAHFVAHVRACGPLPTLRVGNQPYGLVHVTPLARFASRGDVPDTILTLLRDVRPLWMRAVDRVPRIGRPGGRNEQDLLDVLAMQPVSTTYRGRTVLGADYIDTAWRFLREPYADGWISRRDSLVRAELALVGDRLGGRLSRSNLFKAAFRSSFYSLSGPLVQATGGSLAPNYIKELSTATYRAIRDGRIPCVESLSARQPLLCLLLRHALLLEYVFAASDRTWHGGEEELVDIDELDDQGGRVPPQPWDFLGELGKDRVRTRGR